MKHRVIYLILPAFLIAFLLAGAQAASPVETALKIAYVDVEKVLEGYQKWQDYSDSLEVIEKKIKDYKDQVDTRIQKMAQGIEMYIKREDKEAKVREIKQYEAEQVEILKKQYADAKVVQKKYRAEITVDIRKIITEIGKEKAYDAVFTSEVCFYAKYNITDLVIERANRQYEKEKAEKGKAEKEKDKKDEGNSRTD